MHEHTILAGQVKCGLADTSRTRTGMKIPLILADMERTIDIK